MRVLVDKYGFEAPLEDMPGLSMPLVEVLSVDSVQLVQSRQIFFGGSMRRW